MDQRDEKAGSGNVRAAEGAVAGTVVIDAEPRPAASQQVPDQSQSQTRPEVVDISEEQDPK
jgi:hypothetical protein